MKKNYRKIPDFISHRINELSGNIEVAVILDLQEIDFQNPLYSNFNLHIEDGGIAYTEEYIPQIYKGHYSKKNVEGYRIRHVEKPKIPKSYYVGERPTFGDYSKGSFSLYITRMVVPYDDIPPKEISICINLIDIKEVDRVMHYYFKISTSQILNKNSFNFLDDLFFNLNLLQENVRNVNVFSTNATVEDYTNTLSINWEIFPPGQQEQDINIITRGLRNLSPEREREISDRYNFLKQENPEKIIVGSSGMLRYFGAKFSERLIVFENTTYGNALYILFENWEELSKLSRLEIQARPSDQYIRIRHIGKWKEKVKAIIRAKR